MGWPWAAVRRPRGSWYKGLVSQVGQIGRKSRFEEITMAVVRGRLGGWIRKMSWVERVQWSYFDVVGLAANISVSHFRSYGISKYKLRPTPYVN